MATVVSAVNGPHHLLNELMVNRIRAQKVVDVIGMVRDRDVVPPETVCPPSNELSESNRSIWLWC